MRNWIRGYRGFAKAAIILAAIFIIYFYHSRSRNPGPANITQTDDDRVFYIPKFDNKGGNDVHAGKVEKMEKLFSPYLKPKSNTYECSYLDQSVADIDTIREFPNFEFQPRWLQSREFWNKTLEDRYERYLAATDRPPLKVIIVPHSHNDPGWLKTFEGYFQQASRKILNNIVAKLQEYPQMTFIWSEISFLSLWWDSAHPTKQKALKKLIKEGRFEITTGGWVMADEATTHFYSLINQLVEGHLWMKDNLGVIPETAWSVDPFGHGPVIPHLLSSAGLDGAVVQRLHYAWKQWFAYNQIEDFKWIPGWQGGKNGGMLTHNQPYDIYSIRHSCGPHPSVCLNFDFRKIPGEITDYAMKSEPITDENVYNKAALLMGQYMRTGSLTKHNVVLMPLGDDFRYNTELEFNQQYTNYKKLIDHINSNKHLYRNSEVKFGTPKDYFTAIKERTDKFPTLKGDFFVYADIFSEGRPAYWSGYFTTRPFLKLMSRQLEHYLRNAEISFTLALNRVRQSANEYITKRLEKYYESLIKARRNLALFQHHDAITGTSKSIVMYDYGIKMFDSINDCIKIQETSIEALYPRNKDFRKGKFLQSDFDWEMFEKIPEKRVILVGEKRIFVLFNSLAHERYEVISLKINSSNIRIIDNRNKEEIPFQISPVWVNNEMVISETDFNIIFIAHLPKLSLVSYTVEPIPSNNQEAKPFATIYCNLCKMQSNSDSGDNSETKDPYKMNSTFVVKSLLSGDIQLQNPKLKLLIDGTTGFLKSVYLKELRKKKQCSIEFGAYQSAQQHSGAYLFMPNIENPEKDILKQYSDNSQGDHRVAASGIVIISGPIVTEVTSVYQTFLSHTLKIYNSQSSYLNSGMFMENEIDFGNPPKNRETELFMRIQTNIQNGDPPEFFTDQNGFEYQKRIKVQKLPIEGNYYPITTMAFLQDHKTRLTYITDHVQGASAFEPGRLEVMLDRRTLYDDGRGMGEGLVDNRISRFQSWILMESFNITRSYSRFKRNLNTVVFRKERSLFKDNINGEKEPLRHFNIQKIPAGPVYDQPSFNALKLSNTLSFPVNTFVVESFKKMEHAVIHKPHIDFLKGDFPCDVNLVTLRTNTDPEFEEFPQKSSLMILHRMGFSCNITEGIDQWNNCNYNFNNDVTLADIHIQELNLVSLTGLHKGPKLNSFRDINIETMSVQTVNITFA